MTNEDPKVEDTAPVGETPPAATPVRGPTPAAPVQRSVIATTYDLVTRHWPLVALLSSALLLVIAQEFG